MDEFEHGDPSIARRLVASQRQSPSLQAAIYIYSQIDEQLDHLEIMRICSSKRDARDGRRSETSMVVRQQ
jgi:hypothetical protein